MITNTAIEIQYLNDRLIGRVIRERSIIEDGLSFQLLMSEDLYTNEIDVSMRLPSPARFDDGNAIVLSSGIPVVIVRNFWFVQTSQSFEVFSNMFE